jgi:hypothetical protein
MFTTTAQLPATAEAESTITTLLDDTTLHEEAATEQTLAEQLWDPAMKLLPYSVTVLPAYAAVGHADSTEGKLIVVYERFSGANMNLEGLNKINFNVQF